ncbi:MAG: hypothetical protein SVY10_02620 [Thermodesulfobacteriota bacterium]|nr:hypothetical protein [Thermodesulfobacteriota bacterium]
MTEKNPQEQTRIEKIHTLPLNKVTEVKNFVDFLRQRNEDRRLTQDATPSFSLISAFNV